MKAAEDIEEQRPHPQQASFTIGNLPQWGDDLAGLISGWTPAHIALDKPATRRNQVFSRADGSWCALRQFTLDNAIAPLKMDTDQHNRGWDLSIEKGIVSVELVNEAPKGLKVPKTVAVAKPIVKKEGFEYPTPVDLTPKDLAPNKPPEKKSSSKKPEAKKEGAKTGEPKAPTPKPAEDTTPWVGIKVSTTEALPVDGHWRHIFFTYDGSGTASGIKVYVDGAPVAMTVMDKSTRRPSGHRLQCNWAGDIRMPIQRARLATRTSDYMDAH